MSPDLRTTVVVVPRGELACISVGDRVDGCFPGVALSGLAFSEVGSVTAFPVRVEGGWTMLWNGIPGAVWEALGPPVLSSDGARLAYPALTAGSWMVVDGVRPGPPFESIVPETLRFDEGGRLIYVARSAGSSHLVVDEFIGPGWDAISSVTVGPNGRIGYIAISGNLVTTVVDGQPGARHEQIGELALSRDSASFAFSAREAGAWYVVETERKLGPFDEVWALAYTDSGVLGFAARVGGLVSVVMDTKPHGWHQAVEDPVYAGLTGDWGYIATEQEASLVYLNGILQAREEAARDLALSDEKGFAYVATRGAEMEIVDQSGRHPFDLVISRTLHFVEKGDWVALVGDASSRRLFVVRNGVDVGKQLDWSELTRISDRADAEVILRRWVAAAASFGQEASGR